MKQSEIRCLQTTSRLVLSMAACLTMEMTFVSGPHNRGCLNCKMLFVFMRNAFVRQGLWLGDIPKNDPAKHLNPVEIRLKLGEEQISETSHTDRQHTHSPNDVLLCLVCQVLVLAVGVGARCAASPIMIPSARSAGQSRAQAASGPWPKKLSNGHAHGFKVLLMGPFLGTLDPLMSPRFFA